MFKNACARVCNLTCRNLSSASAKDRARPFVVNHQHVVLPPTLTTNSSFDESIRGQGDGQGICPLGKS